MDAVYAAPMAYFKLAYADPRPYMISEKIHPWSCSREFGNPSGHAQASAMVALGVFLDYFHGKQIDSNAPPKYTSWAAYLLGAALALFWATTIPYSRFLLGAHSLDQLVYGSTLGIWCALTCHFLLRDHAMAHIRDVK